MRKILFLMLLLLITFLLTSEVKNPDKPLKGDWELKAQKVWEITELKGNPVISSMMTVSDDGTVYIYDQKYALNYIFDGTGKLKTTFGKRGQGPGEIVSEAFFFSVNDTFIIFDYPSKLHYFLKNGKFIKSVSINNRIMPYFFINEDEYISVPPPGREKAEIRYVNLKTGNKRVIKEIEYKAPVLNRVIVVMPGLTGLMKLSFDQKNKKIYYGINDIYHINIADLKGNIINTFSVKRKKRKISNGIKKKTIFNYLRGSRAEPESEHIFKLIPNEITYFHRIQIEDGFVLVFMDNIGANWKDQQIDIFSLDGKYIYRAVFRPEDGEEIYNSYSFGDIMFIKKGYLYVSLEDSDGEIKVAKYKISLPKL